MLRGLLQRMFVGPWSTTMMAEPSGPIPFVGPSTALRHTPVYRAVTLIAGDIARLELKVSASGADSLMRSPSRYMSAFEFKRTMTLNVLLYGNSFAAINRTRGGELIELLLLEPDAVTLDISGPEPIYKTRPYGDLPMSDVFHLRAPNNTGLWGESPVQLCRKSLQIAAAQEEMALKAYTNAGNPKIALIHPRAMSPEMMQKTEAYYMQRHGGSENAGRPMVLADGMRVERISSTLDDTGLEAARKYSIGDVSRIFGVPTSYLSGDVASSYGSIEWLSRMYVDGALRAWLECWGAEILTKLATPSDSVFWDTDDLIRPKMAEMYAALRTGVESGVITRNEAREELGYGPLPGLDEPMVALNMGTGGGQTNLGTDTSAQEGTPNDF